MDNKTRMRLLADKLNKASDAYYNGREETMTDYEWDALFDELKRLEQETGEILPDSPTNKVSEDNITGQKVGRRATDMGVMETRRTYACCNL